MNSGIYIENAFVRNDMIEAPENYVKIYLLLLSYGENGITDRMIAKILDISEEEVFEGRLYWKKKKEKKSVADSQKTDIKKNTQESEFDAKKKEFASLARHISEKYQKILTSADARTLTKMYYEMGMSCQLIEYLIDTCFAADKKSFRYIETVATDWKGNGINTIEEAVQYSRIYREGVQSVLKWLGLNYRNPTEDEKAYVEKWTNEWQFSREMVKEACRKTIAADIKSNMFAYTDKILENWKKSEIHTLADVQVMEQQKKIRNNPVHNEKKDIQNKKSNKKGFNNFAERNYDMEELEKRLLGN